MTAPTIDAGGYAIIGFLVFSATVSFFRWWISKSLDARFAAKRKEDDDFRQEQIEDAIYNIRAQQVTADCLHVILLSMIDGNHSADLGIVQRELEAYREENTNRLRKKAAKYNLR